MNILIMNCHSSNRGDEAAVRALVDELNRIYQNISISLGMRGTTLYPNLPSNVESIQQLVVTNKYNYKYVIAKMTNGRVAIGNTYSKFFKAVKTADLILHAPGGPSIGDTYYEAEPSYLRVYDMLNQLNKPYMFYAPSMGPFLKSERNNWRKKVLSSAQAIVLRDPISEKHVKDLLSEIKLYQTLDSAFQHDIDVGLNELKLNTYFELNNFICSHEKCIGITITDLLWHPVHSKNDKTVRNIHEDFTVFLHDLVQKGYGVIFIPQLYGAGNDFNLMNKFAEDESHYFIIPDNDDRYDTYFQQYLIAQLYAVIGMRYHSNIFSAKMGTPFVSVSYEQKMQGFMEKMGLDDYCIKLECLSVDELKGKFEKLCNNYHEYKEYLIQKHNEMKQESFATTEIVMQIVKRLNID